MSAQPRRPRGQEAPVRELSTAAAVLVLTALGLFFYRGHLAGVVHLWEDFLYFSYPMRNYAATTLARGEFPLWNPYTFNGMPFFADIQTMVLYLPCLLLTLAAGGDTLHPMWLQVLVVLHVPLAGVTMYFLARSFGARALPAVFAGTAYMLSGFMILHMIHVQIITMVAWFPLILLLFRRVLAAPGWGTVALTALVLGHSVLAGFPQLSLYLYFVLFLVFVFELLGAYRGAALLSPPALHTTLRAAAVIALSLGLTAVQLLPTMELSPLSQRAEITYAKSTEGQMSWVHLFTLLFPKLFGVADAARYDYWGPGVYWYYWETCIYRGILPLLLTAAAALLWRRNRWIPFLLGLTAFTLLFGLGDGTPLHRLFYEVVPGFSTFRNPARIAVFMSLAVSLLSALALQHLLYDTISAADLRRYRRIFAGVLAVAAVSWLLVVSGSLTGALPFLRDPRIAPLANEHTHLAFLLTAVMIAAGWALLLRENRPAWAGGALVGLLFVDLLLFGGTQNDSRQDPREYFRRAGGIVQYIRTEGGDELFRVNSRSHEGMIMDRNQGMVDRLFLLEGYTPLALQRLYPPAGSVDRAHDLLNVKFATVFNPESRSLALTRRTTHLPRAWLVGEVRTAGSEEELTALLQDPTFDPRRTALVEANPGPAVSGGGPTPGEVRITEYRSDAIRMSVRAATDGFLVLSEMYYPGWTAWVDGEERPVYRTNYNLRGITMERGEHDVEFRFTPASFRTGTWISIACLLLCGVLAAAPRLRRHSPS